MDSSFNFILIVVIFVIIYLLFSDKTNKQNIKQNNDDIDKKKSMI